MFGKSNKTAKTNTRTNSNDIFSANTIQNGTVIEGTINSKSSIRIDGQLNGSITTNAKLVVGKTGIIKGDLVCRDASIEGKVEGKILVQGLLDIKSTGFVEGEIVYSKLVVEEGAKLIGRCTIVNSTSKANIHDKGKIQHKKAV